ncbi:MAG: hypothetical protein K8F30_12330, partial [Taibaiella sp.]|nr:hypothetical protein [Taibaiella sp.]
MRLALIAAIVSLLVNFLIIEAQSQQMVITPSDDSWINGSNGTELNGDDTKLSICPLALYWIYLKFDVSELSGKTIADTE